MPPAFDSILHPGPNAPNGAEAREPPDFFHELNLDQVVATLTHDWNDYGLEPFFYALPADLSVVVYRQEVGRDLEREPVMACVQAFAERMRAMRRSLELSRTLDYRHEKERWFLDAALTYCEAVRGLTDGLRPLDLRSPGMQALRDYLVAYVAQPPFRALLADAGRVAGDLAAIRYTLLLKDTSVTVMPYHGEADYTAAVEASFEKFRRGPVTDYRSRFADAGRLDHVEAQVLERVAWLHPAAFAALDAFCEAHGDYQDPRIGRFDREVHFFVAYLSFAGRLKDAGLDFCYPELSATSKEIDVRGAFDLALASQLAAKGGVVVRNDVFLRGPERIIVVSGPNQGGKTTFARMFGQLHYLAGLGLPVPGSAARLYLCDRLFAHFERVEDIRTLRGKLQDDLVRIRQALDVATPRSIVIMNEAFSSTTVHDALFLSRRVLAALSALDLLAVCVTFLDELATFDEKTVSMVSTVDSRDRTVRTFKLERRPADGLAYAVAIAEKYRVTYDALIRRIGA